MTDDIIDQTVERFSLVPRGCSESAGFVNK